MPTLVTKPTQAIPYPQPPVTATQNLHEIVQLISGEAVAVIVLQPRVCRNKGILASNVNVVVHLPVHLPHLPSWMEHPLQGVLQNDGGPQGYTQPFNGLKHCIDHVGGGLKDIWPNIIQQMPQRILTIQRECSKCHMLDSGAGCLPVHEIPVHQRILQKRSDSINVVFAHFPNVLKQEGQRLKDTILYIEFWDPVLIHECRNDSERLACLSHNRNGDSCAHTVLSFLDLQIVEKCRQHIRGPNGLCNVAKGIHCSTPDAFLVGLQELQELKADAHPLTRRNKLSPTVCNAPNKVDAVLLHLLMPVLQDGGQPRQQIFDRGRHFVHSHHINDGLQGVQDGAQHLWILLPKVFI
mmetsp:Transcript_6583/g.12407  ORF Transcript_6583/g.12407 Transcript_6583/m.12407 type:complete len:352 (+) Transcript_6583:251-1306(+)